MKLVLRCLSIGLICAVIITLASCASHQGRSHSLEAGMAETDITPPVGSRIAGEFEERLSTGKHDSLKAKAMVLRQGHEQVALVFCDLVGLDLYITTNARAMASQKTGIPMSHIVIGATHSHTGPLFDDVRLDYFHKAAMDKYGEDPHQTLDYPPFLIDRLVNVIVAAQSKLAPAELDAGIATQKGISFNRRYHMKNGRVAFNPGLLNPNIIGPAGPIDPDVGILMAKDRKHEKPIGGLTVFAMHADTAGGLEFSADYPYFIQQTLRAAFGNDYVSEFGAGTCGDINQIDVSKTNHIKGIDVSERLGTTLGKTILSYQQQLKRIDRPSLAVADKTLVLPLQTVTPKELADGLALMPKLNDTNINFYQKVLAVKAVDLKQRGPMWPLELQVFRLDADTAIACLPAEIFVEFGLAIKKASPFKNTLVIAICNDRPCYVPTLKAFSEGSYETVNSRLKPGDGEEMVRNEIEMLKQLHD